MGAGRSGSTIVGVALGNCADVFFAGELDKWLPRGGEPKLRDAQRVEFWERVRARVGDTADLAAGRPRRDLERSSALLRRGRRSARRMLRGPYLKAMGELYRAVAATADVSYVVDTSHYPLRARELQSLSSVDLYLLLLVRRPGDVVASFARDDVVERRFDPLTTRVYLLLTYLLSSWVFLRHPPERRFVLFYEDLLEDPEGVLRALLDRLGSDAAVPDLTRLTTGIALHANRLIDAPEVSLQGPPPPADEGWGGRLFAALLTRALRRLRPRITSGSQDRHARGPAAPARRQA
jgi:Sulfotransferase family